MRQLSIVCIGLILFFSGCSSLFQGYNYKAGIEDYRIPNDENKTEIITKFFEYNKNNSNTYFEVNDTIDIRLSNIMFSELYDFNIGKNDNKRSNHIGIFVTVKEINNFSPMKDDSNISTPEKALIYVDRIYTKAYANQAFTPIYIQKYHGGDLQLQLDVIEFDTDKKSSRFFPLLEEISKLSKKAVTSQLNGLNMKYLNDLGGTLVDSFLTAHNDLVTSYKFNFIAPSSVLNKDEKYLPYLREGDLVLVKRKAGDKNNAISKWKDFKYDFKLKKIKPNYKNTQGEFQDYYSSIVLTFIRRKKEL